MSYLEESFCLRAILQVRRFFLNLFFTGEKVFKQKKKKQQKKRKTLSTNCMGLGVGGVGRMEERGRKYSCHELLRHCIYVWKTLPQTQWQRRVETQYPQVYLFLVQDIPISNNRDIIICRDDIANSSTWSV